MWNVPESELVASFKGHRDRVSGIDFHPKATVSQSPTSLNFVRLF
jgi:U4/U6 small nuclear ribonucleoprotein PRP4